MGYYLHITRRKTWANEDGPAITETEWRSIIEQNSELTLDEETRSVMKDGEFIFAIWEKEPGALGWYGGEIIAKNPEGPLIRKMVQIARELSAKLEGDDGEIYREDGSANQPETDTSGPSSLGIFDWISRWFSCWRTSSQNHDEIPEFCVGQMVKDTRGNIGMVISVDKKANPGLGSVRVRFDDGRNMNWAIIASGLEIIGQPADKHEK